MKFIIIALLVACALAEMHPVNHQIVAEIKEKATWTPMEVEENPFAFMPIEQIKAMMGTKLSVIEETGEDLGFEADAEFDARTQWPDVVNYIKDQGQCGSCWAFGAVESLEDRICVQSKGAVKSDLSEQHLVTCDWVGMGCSGGWPLSAFGYLSIFGVPTEECQAYTAGQSGEDWGCSSECDDSSVSNQKYRCQYPWMNFSASGIKSELKARGPVETTMMVYEDFINYEGGIYKHVTGKLLGGHAIKMVGWGIEDGVKYWIAANSWSATWGEDGYFRIEEGTSSFGGSAYSCTPYAY
jgi:cathepsin B